MWQKNLEEETKKIIPFFQSNGLSLIASKTEFIVFTKTKRTTNTYIVVDNIVIDEKEAIKVLGIQIDRIKACQEETKYMLKK